MDEVKILQIKQSVFANNDQQAELLRRELKEKGVFLLNLMSSPGSGKTTTLMRTIEALKAELTIGVMEADIDSDVRDRLGRREGDPTAHGRYVPPGCGHDAPGAGRIGNGRRGACNPGKRGQPGLPGGIRYRRSEKCDDPFCAGRG